MGALPEGSDRLKAAFLSSIDKDYEALVKEKTHPKTRRRNRRSWGRNL
jgi:hypothetical protein